MSQIVKKNSNILFEKLTHPDKFLYPQDKLTKLDLAHYYESVAARMLPYIKNRALTLLRCPDPSHTRCFYQKHWMEGLPDSVKKISVPEKNKTDIYMIINNRDALITMAQFDIVEIHPWLSKADKLQYPDQIIFDLDPAPDVKWDDIVAAAYLVRDSLHAHRLNSYPKLTGGKGIHIVAPIRRGKTFDKIKMFAKELAEDLVTRFPDHLTSTVKKQIREGKIFIDYLRNTYGATAVANFSPRARPGAPIAVPISWEKLPTIKSANMYSIKTIDRYFNEYPADPWK